MGDRTKRTPLNKDISNSLHLAQKYAHRFVREHYLFREAKEVYTVCFNEQTMKNYVGLFSYQKQAIVLIIF